MKTVDILRERAAAFRKQIARKEKDLEADRRKYEGLIKDVFKADTGIVEGTRIHVFLEDELLYEGKVEGFDVVNEKVLPKGKKFNKSGKLGKRDFTVHPYETAKLSRPAPRRKKIKWRLD